VGQKARQKAQVLRTRIKLAAALNRNEGSQKQL